MSHLHAGVDHLAHQLCQLDHSELARVADIEGSDVLVIVHHRYQACGNGMTTKAVRVSVALAGWELVLCSLF